jgi:thiamine biosynthesis lipoprotein
VFDPCLPTREGRFGDLELHGEREVRCQAPVELDLGGIAKGYAVDLAVKTLVAAGCHEGVVNLGGDLRAFGIGSHPIAIRHANGYLAPFELRERAIAASALENANRPEEHRGYYTRAEGAPLATFATVVASSAAIADALTKCALYCESEEMDRVAKTFDAQWSRGR